MQLEQHFLVFTRQTHRNNYLVFSWHSTERNGFIFKRKNLSPTFFEVETRYLKMLFLELFRNMHPILKVVVFLSQWYCACAMLLYINDHLWNALTLARINVQKRHPLSVFKTSLKYWHYTLRSPFRSFILTGVRSGALYSPESGQEHYTPWSPVKSIILSGVRSGASYSPESGQEHHTLRSPVRSIILFRVRSGALYDLEFGQEHYTLWSPVRSIILSGVRSWALHFLESGQEHYTL